jgi:hypothetical protein
LIPWITCSGYCINSGWSCGDITEGGFQVWP